MTESLVSDEAEMDLAERTRGRTLVIGDDIADHGLAALDLPAVLATLVHDARLSCHFALLTVKVFATLVEIFIALQVPSWLLEEVKVGLEHDESAVGRLSDQLVLFIGQRAVLLGVCILRK